VRKNISYVNGELFIEYVERENFDCTFGFYFNTFQELKNRDKFHSSLERYGCREKKIDYYYKMYVTDFLKYKSFLRGI
jgi:hypothetical protein